MNKLQQVAQSRWYWISLIGLGFLFEAIALYYQYALDYLPCVLCIHVRIWVLGFILVALAALLLRRYSYTSAISHTLATAMMLGGLERSWLLLGIERGTVFGSCSMESGLPGWFQLDAWFPFMFKVWEACGYTPLLWFKISMAEALTLMFALLLVISSVLMATSIKSRLVKLQPGDE